MGMMFQNNPRQAPQPFGDRRSPIDWSGDLPTSTPPLTAPPMAPSVAGYRPSFFSPGGTGRTIAGVLGDALLRVGGASPIYAPMVQARQQQERQIAEERRRAAIEIETWKAKRAYEQAHPNDQFTQYMRAAGIDPASEQGRGLYRQRAESMAAPPLMAVDGFDQAGNPTKTFMPRTGGGTAVGGISPATAGPAVGTERNGYRFAGGNPNDRNSWVPVGGAPSTGGATFR